MHLTERERILVKIAIASTLAAIKKVNDNASEQMHYYRRKTEGDPAKEGYYDTHRQFTQLGYALEHEIERRLAYDDDLSHDAACTSDFK